MNFQRTILNKFEDHSENLRRCYFPSKLFDAKSNKAFRRVPGQLSTTGRGSEGGGGPGVRLRKPVKPLASSPKTGGGEGMVNCDSGGDPFR